MEAPVPEPHLWLRMPSLVQIPHALPGVVSAPLGLHKMIWSGAWLEVLTVQLLFKCVLKKTESGRGLLVSWSPDTLCPPCGQSAFLTPQPGHGCTHAGTWGQY